MLQVKNIKKSYKTENFVQSALDDLTVSFRDCEFAAILGPSGSGKTTLLNVIGGLDSYDSGDLIVDGISTKKYKSRDWDTYRNNRIGFVFQNYNLISHQSVIKNVEMALTLSGVGKAERKKRAIDALTRVGLADHLNKKPNQLSGGQMQRVAIARALINDPEILLADEPTGALDSQTSLDVMDLLSEIAKDRLVVMVTHNPDLAREYANRIITLKDGRITDDTNPYYPSSIDLRKVSTKETRKSSMSFLTALSLSFDNLMTKKGRTIMTAFAGSVGIIGIAAILALSNGVNNYIRSVEEDTTTSYPIQINKSGMDLSSMMGTSTDSDSLDTSGSSDSSGEGDTSSDTVKQKAVVTKMVNKMANNDLVALKNFIDSNDGANLRNAAASVKYSYSIEPNVYIHDSYSNKYRKINPDATLSSLGLGSESISNSSLSSMMSTNIFSEMIDKSLIEDSYDLKAGKWPESENECVLVLSDNGEVTDYSLFTLGLRDHSELEEVVKSISEEKDVKVSEDSTQYKYSDFLNLEFKVVVASDYYQKDDTYGVWVDKSEDENYLNDLIENKSINMHISGIVQHNPDSKATPLTAGSIYYTSDLVSEIASRAASSQIVADQLASPDTDVISGKSFSDTQSSSDMDLSKMFTIDTDAIKAMFTYDPSSMNLDMTSLSTSFDASDIASFPAIDQEALLSCIGSPTPSVNSAKLMEMVAAMTNDFTRHREEVVKKAGSSADVDKLIQVYLTLDSAQEIMSQYIPLIFDTSEMTSNIANGLQTYLQSYMSQVMEQISATIASKMTSQMSAIQESITSSMQNAMQIDEEAFKNAFKFNMDADELKATVMSMMTTKTNSLDNNLTKLDYADFNKPTSIAIYAKDFDKKQVIVDELDSYNKRAEEAGNEDGKIVYTDIVGTMMSSVRTIIDIISYMLIAFVSISLVVSSIMIGIITYVSVLERTKEIGILRAIGASKSNISQVFNAETTIEGLIAGVMGVGVTALLCIPANIIINALVNVKDIASLPLGAAVILIVISIFLTFVAGLLPAASASRKDPVEALRSE